MAARTTSQHYVHRCPLIHLGGEKHCERKKNTMSPARGLFLESPGNLTEPKPYQNLRNSGAGFSLKTSPFCFVSWYFYRLNFKTINISILNVNTANKKQLQGISYYWDFRERGPRARTKTARSGGQRTNHEASAPAHVAK